MTDHDVSPIESAKLASLLGSLPIDDLVSSVLEATAGGMDFGVLLRGSPAAFLLDAPEAPVERLETALTHMRSGLVGPSTPQLAAGLLACIAALAGRGRLGEVPV